MRTAYTSEHTKEHTPKIKLQIYMCIWQPKKYLYIWPWSCAAQQQIVRGNFCSRSLLFVKNNCVFFFACRCVVCLPSLSIQFWGLRLLLYTRKTTHICVCTNVYTRYMCLCVCLCLLCIYLYGWDVLFGFGIMFDDVVMFSVFGWEMDDYTRTLLYR